METQATYDIGADAPPKCNICRYWRVDECTKEDMEWWGRCSLMTIVSGLCLAYADVGSQGDLGTPGTFSCGRFEPKPPGPFTVIHPPRAGGQAFLRFQGRDLDTGSFKTFQALGLADILNELWRQTEKD